MMHACCSATTPAGMLTAGTGVLATPRGVLMRPARDQAVVGLLQLGAARLLVVLQLRWHQVEA